MDHRAALGRRGAPSRIWLAAATVLATDSIMPPRACGTQVLFASEQFAHSPYRSGIIAGYMFAVSASFLARDFCPARRPFTATCSASTMAMSMNILARRRTRADDGRSWRFRMFGQVRDQ